MTSGEKMPKETVREIYRKVGEWAGKGGNECTFLAFGFQRRKAWTPCHLARHLPTWLHGSECSLQARKDRGIPE